MIDEHFFQLFAILVVDGKWLRSTIDKAPGENTEDIGQDELARKALDRTQIDHPSPYDNSVLPTDLVDLLGLFQTTFGEHDALRGIVLNSDRNQLQRSTYRKLFPMVWLTGG